MDGEETDQTPAPWDRSLPLLLGVLICNVSPTRARSPSRDLFFRSNFSIEINLDASSFPPCVACSLAVDVECVEISVLTYEWRVNKLPSLPQNHRRYLRGVCGSSVVAPLPASSKRDRSP